MRIVILCTSWSDNVDRPDQQAENATEQPIAQQLNLIYLAGKQSPVSQEEEVIRKRASELIDEKNLRSAKETVWSGTSVQH